MASADNDIPNVIWFSLIVIFLILTWIIATLHRAYTRIDSLQRRIDKLQRTMGVPTEWE